jgi:hypothetical protein
MLDSGNEMIDTINSRKAPISDRGRRTAVLFYSRLRDCGFGENKSMKSKLLKLDKKIRSAIAKNYETYVNLNGTRPKVKLKPVVFEKKDKNTHFDHLIRLKNHSKTLFIFNDNEESFLSESCEAGGGNAIIRPYSCGAYPKAAGIPTGVNGTGYLDLTTNVRKIINDAIRKIVYLLKNYPFNQIVYSANRDGTLGSGIFDVSEKTKKFIMMQLRLAVRKVNKDLSLK